MKLQIKQIEQRIEILFSKEKLTINLNKEDREFQNDWTAEKINDFLIKLISKLPDDEVIEIEKDDQNDNAIYKHICTLFEVFCTEYNTKEQK